MAQRAESAEVKLRAEESGRERAEAEVNVLRTLAERASESAESARQEADSWRQLFHQERQKNATHAPHLPGTDQTVGSKEHVHVHDVDHMADDVMTTCTAAAQHSSECTAVHSAVQGQSQSVANESGDLLGPAATERSSTVSPGVQTTDSAVQLQSNFTDLANGLVGALTQAFQASSQTTHNQDNNLRRLTAR